MTSTDDIIEAVTDLRVEVVGMKTDLKHALKWQEKHEKDDKSEHAALHVRISSLSRFGKAIAIVSGFFCAGIPIAWGKLTGKF